MKIMKLIARYIPKAIVYTFGVFALACGGKGLVQPTAGEEKANTQHRPDFELPEGTVLRRDEKNGTVTFLKAENLSQPLDNDSAFRELQETDQHAGIALTFIASIRELFKLSEPQRELSAVSVADDELGLTHIKLQQRFDGLPVWGAELIVHLNKANQVYLMQGQYIPTPSGLSVSPGISEDEAYRVVAKNLGRDSGDCPGCEATLVIFPVDASDSHLAYHVASTVSLTEAWEFMIDAQTGAILNKLSAIQTGRSG